MPDSAACNYSYQLKHTIRGTSFRMALSRQGGSGVAAEDQQIGIQGLVQSFNIALQRQVTTVYDLASDDIYQVEGIPQGQAQFNKVMSPCPAGEFLDCSCAQTDIILDFGSDVCEDQCPSGFGLVLKNVHQGAAQMQGSVTDRVVAYSATYQFTHVEKQA